MLLKRHKFIFYLLVFLLPLNLGKHFIFRWSYVNGLLVDYLVPTVYVTDLLIVFLLLSYRRSKFTFAADAVRIFVIFIVSVALSVLSSVRFYPSLFSLVQLLLHIGLAFYVVCELDLQKEFSRIAGIFGASVFLLSVLGILQWVGQGSFFDDYLIFGEQPYSSATYGVAREGIFGKTVIPPYGLFRHPNVFGGFLSVTLLWLVYKIKERKEFAASFLLGVVVLFLTFSQGAWISFVLGALFLILIRRFGKAGVIGSLLSTGAVVSLGMLLPFFPYSSKMASTAVRSALFDSGARIISERPLFGTGLNTSSVVIEKYLDLPSLIRFPQPVHNIFFTILLESGLFALASFILTLFYAGYLLLKQNFGPAAFVFVSLLQFLILGSFDHYLWTIQQTQLLFWLTLGFALSYTKQQ